MNDIMVSLSTSIIMMSSCRGIRHEASVYCKVGNLDSGQTTQPNKRQWSRLNEHCSLHHNEITLSTPPLVTLITLDHRPTRSSTLNRTPVLCNTWMAPIFVNLSEALDQESIYTKKTLWHWSSLQFLHHK